MAKSALGRRRGTKTRSGGICGDHPMLRTLFIGMVLVSVGIIGGLLIGLTKVSPKNVESGSTNVNVNANDSINANANANSSVKGNVNVKPSNLRVARDVEAVSDAAAPPQKLAVAVTVDVTGMSLAQRKDAFLAHTPSISNSGPFPYYPDNGQLVDPNHDFSTFRAQGGKRYEEWKHGDSPYTYKKGESDDLARSRRYQVKKAMKFAWAAYEQYAFGMDEIKPETMVGANGWGGFGTTLVDSLDTLWLMDMKDEFQRARDWVRDSLNNNRNTMVSFFETTIRSLGGLLAGEYSRFALNCIVEASSKQVCLMPSFTQHSF